MFAALARKSGQVLSDPVLRRWIAARALGREPRAPSFTAGRPPYLSGRASWPNAAEGAPEAFRECAAHRPSSPLVLDLPGAHIALGPGEAAAVFARRFPDLETTLAVHRFAWLPLQGAAADPAWVAALWRAWSQAFGRRSNDWPWHPYTVAERAINLLEFGRRHGLPGPLPQTLAALADHADAIADRLEYFGDHNTSNHLANNGRGLYLIGLALGRRDLADLGQRILLAEARRIFGASGMLREGSSHYHLLLARNYASVWLAARRHGRAEEAALAEIVRRALAVVPALSLPARLPLIGDISPDCPPTYLAGLAPGGDIAQGWGAVLDRESRAALARLKAEAGRVDEAALRAEGWARFDLGPWSGLWHAAPLGWTAMPGHGHQDIGSFELDHGEEVLFADPGRGAYGANAASRREVAAAAHNSITVDDRDPYPPNRPYYSTEFRRRVGGPAPVLSRHAHGVSITHDGYRRLDGVGTMRRNFTFDAEGLSIDDHIEGHGRRRIARRLNTPHAVTIADGGATIQLRQGRLRLSWGAGHAAARPVTLWSAYGDGRTGTAIEIACEATLPFRDRLTMRAA